MKRLRTIAVVGALLAIVAAPLAYAAGLWFGLPIVGGPSYCAGQTTAGVPGTTAVCNTTAPAGPGALTGNEYYPADLNPQGGNLGSASGPGTGTSAPQTGLVPVASGASGAYQLLSTATPSVTATYTINNGVTNVIAPFTGTQTYTAFLLPLNPYDGQIVRITANATITTLIVTTGIGSTATVDTPTKVVSPFNPQPGQTPVQTTVTLGGVEYLFNLSNNKWFRLQ